MTDDVNPYASPQAACANTAGMLPAVLAAEIERLMEPGERLVWHGRPQFSAAGFFKSILFNVTLLLVLLSPIVMLRANPVKVALLSLGFLLFLAVVTIPGFLVARCTAYALTNRRLLICDALPPFTPRTQIFLPEDVAWKSANVNTNGGPTAVEMPVPPWSLLGGIGDRVGVRTLIANTLLSELARRLRHADPAIRRRSAARIARIGPAAAWFTAPLLAALRDDDSIVRRHAAVALGRARAASARAELERLRGDQDRRVARAAAAALDKLNA